MNGYSLQFNKLLVSGGDPLRERRIAHRAAADLNKCSRQLDDCLDEFRKLATLLTQSLNGLRLAWPDKVDVQQMIQQSAVIMIPSLQAVRVSQLGYKDSIQSIVGAAETLNDAASRHVAITDTFIDLLSNSLEIFTKLQDDATERIKSLAPPLQAQ